MNKSFIGKILLFSFLLFLCINSVSLNYSTCYANSLSISNDNSLMITGTISFNNSNKTYSATNNNFSLIRTKDLKTTSIFNTLNEDTIRCSFLDENHNVITTKIIDNPLIEKVESTMFDNKTLYSKYNILNSANYMVRTSYSPDIKYLKMETLNNIGEVIFIDEITISLPIEKKINPTPKFEVTKIIDNGDPKEKINIVIMGDGFTYSEQNNFITEATKISNYLLNSDAYKENSSNFNIYAIKVISNVSGVADDPSALIDNYFGTTYNYAGIRRLVYATKSNLVYSTAAEHVPNYDSIIVLANDTEYGGSGGNYSTVSINSQSPEIVVHELGHSFAGLSDEYWAGIQYARENINMTQDTNPLTVRWKNFLGVDGVGIYKIDYSYDWYAPHQYCRMRYLGYDFCAVCKNAHKEKIAAVIKEKAESNIPAFAIEDVNKDGFIDINDIAAIAEKYNLNKNDADYDITYDINNDNIIDLYDFIIVAKKIV